MNDKNYVIDLIHGAFGNNEYPGDDYLIGSREGTEPTAEIEPFLGLEDWTKVDPNLLDIHNEAFNFFSEAGLRYFLPAYLIADLNGELKTADPLFILVHGFSDFSIEHKVGSRTFVRMTGKSAFVNPRRYGTMTFFDYGRYRLSIFTREEAQAIVFYLKHRQEIDSVGMEREQIEAALNSFWLERAEIAPTAQDISVHMFEEDEYLAAISSQVDENS
jgi:hypothetical protein